MPFAHVRGSVKLATLPSSPSYQRIFKGVGPHTSMVGGRLGCPLGERGGRLIHDKDKIEAAWGDDTPSDGNVFAFGVLARRPITLVLMMINSCSYSTNDLVFS